MGEKAVGNATCRHRSRTRPVSETMCVHEVAEKSSGPMMRRMDPVFDLRTPVLFAHRVEPGAAGEHEAGVHVRVEEVIDVSEPEPNVYYEFGWPRPWEAGDRQGEGGYPLPFDIFDEPTL